VQRQRNAFGVMMMMVVMMMMILSLRACHVDDRCVNFSIVADFSMYSSSVALPSSFSFIYFSPTRSSSRNLPPRFAGRHGQERTSELTAVGQAQREGERSELRAAKKK
jgi:hypothetical protein